jgi:hypothetical protein
MPCTGARLHWARVPLHEILDATERSLCCKCSLCEVAPDAVIQRAMRHTSPETKLHYQLGMAEQVRNALDKANKRLYGKRQPLHFRDSRTSKKEKTQIAVCNYLKKKEKLAPRARFELATLRLTAECSTVELPGIRLTPLFSFYYRKQILAMTFRNHMKCSTVETGRDHPHFTIIR